MTKDKIVPKKTSAKSLHILLRRSNSEPFDNSFNYRSISGKLNHLERGSHSDISYAAH